MKRGSDMKNVNTHVLMMIAFLAVSSPAYGDDGRGLKFEADLSQDQEIPTPGPGNITNSEVKVRFDDAFTQVAVELKVAGGMNVTRAHFHCAHQA